KLAGGALDQIANIDLSSINPRIKDTKFLLASDVTNPLTGPNGASSVFGPQKGADDTTVKILDQNLSHYAQVIEQTIDKNVAQISGSGAAGGLGAGLIAFTNHSIHPGVQLILQATNLEAKIKAAAYVFN